MGAQHSIEAAKPRSIGFVPACLLAVAIIVILTGVAAIRQSQILPSYFFWSQDLAGAVASVSILLMIVGLSRRTSALVDSSLPLLTPKVLGAVLLAVAAFCFVGHHLVLAGHALSRDEQMALFDARIFASGGWTGTIPAEWVGFRGALNTVFLDTNLTGSAWASTYRPVNALLHAPGVAIGLPELVSPLLVALAIWATWRCARKIWPHKPEPALVAVVLMALGSQLLVSGMTSYAMNGLLALNMLWLLLFMQDRPRAHAAALVIGFMATGMHQLLYHPVFAFPALTLLVIDKRWRLAALYAVAYLGFLAFWDQFPVLREGWAGVPDVVPTGVATPVSGTASQLGGMTDRLAQGFSFDPFLIQAANLVRFVTWQHVLLLPLALIGAHHAWRHRAGNRWLLVFLAMILLTVWLKTVHRPYQGHGWGYRYLHGELGVAGLLAAGGWRILRERGQANARLFVLASLASLALLLPMRLVQARAFSESYAVVDRAIARSRSDILIVDDLAAPFAQDLVVNDPFVRNRPVRLAASALTPNDVVRLCRRGPIVVFGANELRPVNAELGRVRTDSPTDTAIVVTAARKCGERR